MIDLPQDFRDLLVELADAGAEFVVVGGHAVAFHGHPRATKDLDVLVRSTAANAAIVYRALAAFGAPLQAFEVGPEDFASYDGVLQLGVPPRRIDVLNRAAGISFDDAVEARNTIDVDGRRIPVIGLSALLQQACGGPAPGPGRCRGVGGGRGALKPPGRTSLPGLRAPSRRGGMSPPRPRIRELRGSGPSAPAPRPARRRRASS